MLMMEVAATRVVAARDISACHGQNLRPIRIGNRSSCSVWTPSRRALAPRRLSTQECQPERKWRGCTAANLHSSSNVLKRESSARELVDTLLSLVDGSDRGTLLSDQEQGKVEQVIASLEQQCMPEPLKSPFLFGEWDVVYSSNPTATGGYYRSAIGRVFLTTKQMMQTVKEPDYVSNKVSFAALGILDGEVSLRGKLEALDDKWIKINFESPNLELGGIKFQYGGKSSVKIAILYLDERVRLGRGSRGSLFVFKRC